MAVPMEAKIITLAPPKCTARSAAGSAKMLGLDAKPDFEQFKRLLNGLNPHTGEQLTARIDSRPPCGLGRNRLDSQRGYGRSGSGR